MSTQRSDEELQKDVYAVLFSVGKRMLLEEIARVVKEKDVERVKQALSRIKVELDSQSNPVFLMQEGQEYKLQVRSKFLDLVQKVVRQTELPKSVLETLAVVAYKTPVLQSDIIRIRTNKAYAHLDMLEEKGFIGREQHGRTRLVRVTNKFYEYFEISPEEFQRHIAKRQIREEGEQQQKITAIVEKAGELEVYGQAKEPTAIDVYEAQNNTQSVEPAEQDERVQDDSETLFVDEVVESDESSKDADKDVQTHEEETPPDSVADKWDEHDSRQGDEVNAKDNHIHAATQNEHPRNTSPDRADANKIEQDDENGEYEPPRVKGGFTEFSDEEKHEIKERSDEITGDEDEDSE